MKYRIKIVTYKTGRKTFTPFFKTRFGWMPVAYDGECGLLCDYKMRDRESAIDAIDKHYEGNTKTQRIEFEYITKQAS